MKTIVNPILLFFCVLQISYSQAEDGVVALDVPVRNSLTFNRFEVNPTFSFVREQNKHITVTSKREMLQIEDAPQTYLFNYSGRFGENIGAGIGFFQQNYGVLTTFGGMVNFAYNARLQQDSNLTFGINIGAYKSGLDSGRVVTNIDDPALDNVPSNFLLTLNPGLNYGTGFMDFGVSLNNVVTYNITSSALIEQNPKQGFQGHIMYTGYLGGYSFFGNSRFSTLARSEFQKDSTIFSGVIMLAVPKGIWTQVGYNTMYGASGGLGVNITKQIAIEYNYEKPFLGLSDLGPSHEITLAYKFKNDNHYDYSRADDIAGLISLDKKRSPKPNKKKVVATPDEELEILPELEPEEIIIDTREQERIASKEQARLKAEEAARIASEEQSRLKAEETARIASEEQSRLKAEEAARIASEEQTRLKAEEAARIASEEQARLKAEEAARIASEEQARLKAEETARIASEEQARLKAEEAARIASEEQVRLKAEEAARIASEEQARLKAEEAARIASEEQARIEAEKNATENLIKNPTDNIGTTINSLVAQTEASTLKQRQLLKSLVAAVSSKEKDLKDLKEENDQSEQNIYVEPKPFKSISEENKAIELIRIDLDTIILRQKMRITQLGSLLEERVKTMKDPNDATNIYYLKTLAELKTEQAKAISYRESLVSSLKQITIATDFERKRRIKKAAYDNDQDRYRKDRSRLNYLRKNVSISEKSLTKEDFDFGDERSNNIQILKNIENTENAYYLVLAVHNDAKKRDEFLTKVISTGTGEVDFFYDVKTSEYYIYTKKFNSIEEVNNAIRAKDDKVYNEKTSIIKIEN